MRRYKIVACIFLILSVFCIVLAAPVAVQEAREACADAVDGGDNVIIGPGKRAEGQEEDPLLPQEPSSSSDLGSTLSQDQGSSSTPNHASLIDPNPSLSLGESKSPLLSTSGGTELSWNPEDDTKLIQPGTSTTDIQPTPSSQAKSVSFAPEREVILPSGIRYSEKLPPETGLIQAGTSTDIQPASSSKVKSVVSFAPEREVILPSGETYSEELPPDTETLPRPLWLDVYKAKIAKVESQKPQSKNIFKKLVSKLRFKAWRRFSGTAGGIVTEGQRDLQGTVDT